MPKAANVANAIAPPPLLSPPLLPLVLPLAPVLPLLEVLVPLLLLVSVEADPLGCEVLPELAPVLLLGFELPVSEPLVLLPVCPEVAAPDDPPVCPVLEPLEDGSCEVVEPVLLPVCPLVELPVCEPLVDGSCDVLELPVWLPIEPELELPVCPELLADGSCVVLDPLVELLVCASRTVTPSISTAIISNRIFFIGSPSGVNRPSTGECT